MKPYPRKGSDYLYIKFTYNKVVRHVCTYETDMRKATRIATRVMQKWIADHESGAALDFDALCRFDEKRYMARRSGAGHFDSTCGLHWRRLAEFFDNPSTITHDDLEDYIIFRKKQLRPDGTPLWRLKTIKEHLTTLKRGLLLARDAKGFDGLKIPKVWPQLIIPADVKGQRYASNDYSTDTIIRMISLLQGHARDEAMILVCTGMRGGEAEKCKWEHFTPRHDMPGCAGILYIPPGEEDKGRYVGIPIGLLPMLQRALPLTISHKRIYSSAIKRVTGSPKFGRRDFRSAFLSSHAIGDTFGAHKVAGHKGQLGSVKLRYHNMDEARMAALAVATWQTFGDGPVEAGLRLVPQLGSDLGSEMGSGAYKRRRLAVEGDK